MVGESDGLCYRIRTRICSLELKTRVRIVLNRNLLTRLSVKTTPPDYTITVIRGVKIAPPDIYKIHTKGSDFETGTTKKSPNLFDEDIVIGSSKKSNGWRK